METTTGFPISILGLVMLNLGFMALGILTGVLFIKAIYKFKASIKEEAPCNNLVSKPIQEPQPIIYITTDPIMESIVFCGKYTTLRDCLNQYLKQKNIKKQDLANKLGIASPSLYRLLHEQSYFRDKTYDKLERAFGISREVWKNFKP